MAGSPFQSEPNDKFVEPKAKSGDPVKDKVDSQYQRDMSCHELPHFVMDIRAENLERKLRKNK